MRFARMLIEQEAPNLVGWEHMDANLSESSVRDRSLKELEIDLSEMSLPYGHHFGEPKLRQVIADQSGAANIAADDIIVTAGAAGALFLLSSSLLEPGDRLVVAMPNYATNYETPHAIGADVVYVEQTIDDDFALNVVAYEAAVTPATKLISITTPHNPSGTVVSTEDLDRLIALAEKNDCLLLVDETYREMGYGEVLPLAASRSPRVISVSSMSKSWGVPGIRVGWLVCRDHDVITRLIAGKEQIAITGSVVDEEIAYQILSNRERIWPGIKAEIDDGLTVMEEWIESEQRVRWVRPLAGAACIIDVTGATDEQMHNIYAALRDEYRLWVAPGYWFKMPLSHIRIGFCWEKTAADTRRGLDLLSQALDKHLV